MNSRIQPEWSGHAREETRAPSTTTSVSWKLGPGGLHVHLQRRIGGDPAPVQGADRGGQQRAVTDLRDRLVRVEERLQDLAQFQVVAEILGSSPARDHQGHVLPGVHLGEGEVGGPGVAGFLGVGVEAVLEVVHHETERLAARGRDMHLVALLAQPLVGIEHLKGLGRVAGHDEDLRRHAAHLQLWMSTLSTAPSPCIRSADLPRGRGPPPALSTSSNFDGRDGEG